MYQFVGMNEESRATGSLAFSFAGVDIGQELARAGGICQVVTVSGRGLLAFEPSLVEVGGRHGRFFRQGRLAYRTVSVTVRLAAQTDRAFRLLFERLNQLLHQAGAFRPARLTFSDEPERYYQAVFLSADVPEETSNDQFVGLQFACYDPFKYRPVPVVSGTVVTNRGQMPSWPLITLTLQGEGSELRLLHVESQQYVRLKGIFRPGQVIKIDMKKRTVTQNGRSILSDLDMVNSRFFPFRVGVNTLSTSLAAGIVSEYSEVFM